MNKSEKLICVFLGLLLVGWLWRSMAEQKRLAAARAAELAAAATGAVERVEAPAPVRAVGGVAQTAALKTAEGEVRGPASEAASMSAPEERAVPRAPETLVTLSNAQMAVTFTTRGGAVKRATLFGYAERPGAVSAENPAVSFDFGEEPALGIAAGGGALRAGADWTVVSQAEDAVAFALDGAATRTFTLRPDYQIAVRDEFAPRADWDGAYAVTLGALPMGASKNGLLSIDSMSPGPKGDKPVHWGEEDALKSYLVAGMGGCGGRKDATGLPAVQTVPVRGPAKWLAVKNRFFVSALARTVAAIDGFDAVVARDEAAGAVYKLKSAAVVAHLKVAAAGDAARANETLFYLGPKKQSLLWGLGLRDVMEFGMWRWVCYPMVWVLNLFHSWIPNFGVAIILLTILVRLVFWPLTHKSTVSMRRMSEIQPKMKEIREKFKDNPQRLQQETWALYRDNKVNPMASCLPMLVQIPVFIALFTVLRSAVELRYAPFLWIADLSEPEALFADWFPFGGLNVLPILMAATMAIQSALTPAAGDRQQQRMMMFMMPAMMLFMFYSFPSALSLYWTLSQVVSIAQTWYIRKRYTPAPVAASADVVDVPVTRQMRRHGGA